MMFGKYSRLGIALTSLPLYAGPFLAGWMDASGLALLVLAALFFLGQLGACKDKSRGQMPLVPFLLMLAGAQLIAVAVVYGAGVVVRLVAGPVGVPLWLPLACTAVGAVIFARRYRYDPREEEAMAAIEDAIDQITRITPPYDGDDPDGSSAR